MDNQARIEVRNTHLHTKIMCTAINNKIYKINYHFKIYLAVSKYLEDDIPYTHG